MKSLYFERYGGSEVLSLREVRKPVPETGQVLVKVHSASVNPLDWRLMRADPFLLRFAFGLFRPKSKCLGVDFSGSVEAVGPEVEEIEPGEAVFGVVSPGLTGSFAEYITVSGEVLVSKPDSISHQQASTLGVAALTGYQGIHDYHQIESGDRVLINGASGGTGTFAVQMAKVLGGHVTAVCSGRNRQLVRGLGADEVIDYQKVDLLGVGHRFDLIFDAIGNHPPKRMKRLLREGGRLVLVSASSGTGFIKAMAISRNKKEPVDLILDLKKDRRRLQSVLGLLEAGKIRPVIDREYPFEEIIQAIEYVATKRARGKVVVNIVHPEEPNIEGAG